MANAEDAEPDFPVARHGYDRAAVREHLRRLATSAEAAVAERDRATADAKDLAAHLSAARRQVESLKKRLDEIDGPNGTNPSAEHRAARMLQTAKAQADEILSRAQLAAETSWSAAEQASGALREHYQRMLADLDRKHAELHVEHTTFLRTTREQAEQLTGAAERRTREIDDGAERARRQIDEDFQQFVERQRVGLAGELESQRTASTAEAQRRVEHARAEAERRIAVATEEVRRLNELRERLAERLRGTTQLLASSAPLLEPLEGEVTTMPASTVNAPPGTPLPGEQPSPKTRPAPRVKRPAVTPSPRADQVADPTPAG
jgi:cell division septum initiation protein DivIVA